MTATQISRIDPNPTKQGLDQFFAVWFARFSHTRARPRGYMPEDFKRHVLPRLGKLCPTVPVKTRKNPLERGEIAGTSFANTRTGKSIRSLP